MQPSSLWYFWGLTSSCTEAVAGFYTLHMTCVIHVPIHNSALTTRFDLGLFSGLYDRQSVLEIMKIMNLILGLTIVHLLRKRR
jgi:hypothetical protein